MSAQRLVRGFAQILGRLDPPRAEQYRDLAAVNDLLVAVRSAYRVAVAATDEVERDQLGAPARILGYEGSGAGARLFADVERGLAQSATQVDRLIAAAVAGAPGGVDRMLMGLRNLQQPCGGVPTISLGQLAHPPGPSPPDAPKPPLAVHEVGRAPVDEESRAMEAP